jgi:protein-L-isoaspartate(D-aspartate) O-methyltransferase
MTTFQYGPGEMLLVTRLSELAFASRFLCPAAFIDFQGARDPATSHRLAAALRRDHGTAVRSLRRDSHQEDETCWLHGEGWCLSLRVPGNGD